jgi:hypothetical protein
MNAGMPRSACPGVRSSRRPRDSAMQRKLFASLLAGSTAGKSN